MTHRPSIFRTLIGWIVGFFITMFFAFLVLTIVTITRNGNWGHKCAQLWGKSILWLCGIRVTVSGQEHLLSEQRPMIIVANHQSMFDIFTLSGHFPVRFSWIAKDTLFRIPLVGRAMLLSGYIPIERANPERAHHSISMASRYLQSHSVIIFPEGTRSRSGAIGRFKRGASHLAHESGAPILPVTITGSWHRLPPGKWLISPGVIALHIDAPVPVDGKSRDEIAACLNGIRDRMIARVEGS